MAIPALQDIKVHFQGQYSVRAANYLFYLKRPCLFSIEKYILHIWIGYASI